MPIWCLICTTYYANVLPLRTRAVKLSISMIKAEVVPHDGTEVPNWVTKCRDAVTGAPIISTFAVVIVVVIVLLAWNNSDTQLVNETGAQSQPTSSSTLQVLSSDNLPVPTASTIRSAGAGIGPAPTSSRDSLQPTGLTQNNAPDLSHADQSVQDTDHASPHDLSNLDL